MTDGFYSVEQVAERLGLHVRTIRNYVRDGRLAAVRVGKQYRIAHEDLEAFVGREVPARPPAGERHVEVSSIVEVDGIDTATADRLTALLMSLGGGDRRGEAPLRIETVHDRERNRMKVIVLGGLRDAARVLDYIEGVLAP